MVSAGREEKMMKSLLTSMSWTRRNRSYCASRSITRTGIRLSRPGLTGITIGTFAKNTRRLHAGQMERRGQGSASPVVSLFSPACNHRPVPQRPV